jgi:ribosomal protein L20
MFFLDDLDDRIFELREQGISYTDMSKMLKKQGIKIQPFMIEERCKTLYRLNNRKEPENVDIKEYEAKKKEKEAKEKEKEAAEKAKIKEFIFKLRSEEKTYQQIQDALFEELNVKKCLSEIRTAYLEYCKEKNIAEPKKRVHPELSPEVPSQEVFALRESGYSYQKIINYFEDKKIIVSRDILITKYKEECIRVGREYHSRIKLSSNNELIALPDDVIFALREQSYTYDRIVDYFKEEGIKVTKETIRQRCKRIYAEKGKEEPRVKHKLAPEYRSAKYSISDEEIIELKEQGLTNRQIVEHYKQKGIKIGITTITNKCREAFKNAGKAMPPRKRKVQIDISDEEIFSLREKRLTYSEIVDYYKEKGIQVSKSTIENRCKKVYAKKGSKNLAVLRNRLPDVLNEEIEELRKRKFTYKDIIKYYKEKGISVSRETLRMRCLKIHNERQASLEELNNTLTNLLIKKQQSEELLQQYTGVLISKKEDIENER